MSLARWAWVLLAGAIVVAVGCDEDAITGATGPGGTGANGAGAGGMASSSSGPPVIVPSGFSCSGATPTLSNEVVPITTQSCSGVDGCHLSMHSPAGVYDFLVNRIAEQCLDGRLTIKPGDPENSYVIHKMLNLNICANTEPMPRDGTMLPAVEIQV